MSRFPFRSLRRRRLGCARRLRPAAVVLLLLAAVAAPFGCTRAYYRRQADTEAYELVHEKATHPHWPLDGYTIEVDPRSRMFDPYSPDRPPMPQELKASLDLVDGAADQRAGWESVLWALLNTNEFFLRY